MSFFVYILLCADNTYYVGCTNNLIRRVKQHNTSKIGAHYTKLRRPVVLQYFEEFKTLSEGRKREATLKRLKHTQKAKLTASNAIISP